MRIGDTHRFAVELGNTLTTDDRLRQVDVWAAGQWLTCVDNVVFVPQFVASVQADLRRLRSGFPPPLPFPAVSPQDTHVLLDDYEKRCPFTFMGWGPTADNVCANLFRDGDSLVLTCHFWSLGVGTEVFVATITADELASILEQLLAALGFEDHSPRFAERR